MADTGAVPKKRICPTCKLRMSSLDKDPHLLCLSCRETKCSFDTRCDTCISWSDDQMNNYIRYQDKLRKDRERKKAKLDSSRAHDLAVLCTGGGESSVSGVGESGSEGPDDSVSVADSQSSVAYLSSQVASVNARFDSVVEGLDDRIASVVGQTMAAYFSANPSFSAPRQVPVQLTSDNGRQDPSPSKPPNGEGQVAARVERVPDGMSHSPSPVDSSLHDWSASIKALQALGLEVPSQLLDKVRVPPGGMGAQGADASGCAGSDAGAGSRGGADGSRSPRVELPGGSGPGGQGVPKGGKGAGSGVLKRGSAGTGSGRPSGEKDSDKASSIIDDDRDEEMDDTRSEAPTEAGIPAVDFARLYDLVVGFHPSAKPSGDREPPPRCLSEGFFSQEDPTSKKPKRFRFCERFARVRMDVREKLSKIADEGKRKFTSVLGRKRGSYKVAEDDFLDKTPKINSAYSRLATPVSTKASVWISLEDVGKIETSIAGLVEAQSFSMWLLAGLLSYVIDCGFTPPDKLLFDKFCSSLSLSMVDQNVSAASFQAYLALLKRDLYLQHCPPTVDDGQKARLLASDPFAKDLFDPDILAAVIEEHKGDSVVATQASFQKFLTNFSVGSTPAFKRKAPSSAADSQGPSTSGAALAGTPLGPSRGAAPSTSASGSAKTSGKQRFRHKRGKGSSYQKGGSKPSEAQQGFQK